MDRESTVWTGRAVWVAGERHPEYTENFCNSAAAQPNEKRKEGNLGVVPCARDSGIYEKNTEGLLQVWGQPGVQGETKQSKRKPSMCQLSNLAQERQRGWMGV